MSLGSRRLSPEGLNLPLPQPVPGSAPPAGSCELADQCVQGCALLPFPSAHLFPSFGQPTLHSWAWPCTQEGGR